MSRNKHATFSTTCYYCIIFSWRSGRCASRLPFYYNKTRRGPYRRKKSSLGIKNELRRNLLPVAKMENDECKVREIPLTRCLFDNDDNNFFLYSTWNSYFIQSCKFRFCESILYNKRILAGDKKSDTFAQNFLFYRHPTVPISR